MKTMLRNVLSLSLTVLLLLGMTACGAPQEDTVIGTWDYQFVAPGNFGIEGGLTQHLSLILREDGTFSFGPNTEKMRSEISANIDAMMAYTIEQNSGTMTVDELYAQLGVTRDEMIEELLSSMVGYGSDGTYKTDGEKLYLVFADTEENPDEYYTYAFSEGRLVLTLPEGVSPAFQLAPADMFPLSMNRGA